MSLLLEYLQCAKIMLMTHCRWECIFLVQYVSDKVDNTVEFLRLEHLWYNEN